MLKSMYSGVSGLKTHQQKMDVIGNNIANVNTAAYKTQQVTFKDIYYQTKRTPTAGDMTSGGVNPRQVGYGVKMGTTTSVMTQSGFTYSDSIYDMAISGEGFFQVMDPNGNTFYTRSGAFNVDSEGNLVDSNGYRVLGISGDSDGQAAGIEPIKFVINATEDNVSSATKIVSGVEITISVSAPSNNTDMIVTFTDGKYPYATYADGKLELTFDMSKQFESEADFQAAIANAIQIGGVSLPDDMEVKVEFGSVPTEPEALTASNTASWLYSTPTASGTSRVAYTYNDGVADVTKDAQLSFNTEDLSQNGEKVTVASGAALAVAYTAGTGWTVTIAPDTTMSTLNTAIKDYIKAQAAAGTAVPSISCTYFIVPADATARTAALTALAAAPVTLAGGDGQVDLQIDATTAGVYANDYKVTFAYSASYGNTKAAWDGDNLTLTICNDTTEAGLNAAIIAASNADKDKQLTISGMAAVLNTMNPMQREAIFDENPALSLAGGKDSFYTEVSKNLTNFTLKNGRIGEGQTIADLDNVTVQNDGTIIGYHAVHGYITLGRVDIATFDNPNGLSLCGDSYFQETVASGAAQVTIPGQNGSGDIVSGALEMSNVDLSQEFSDLITTQRGFQANSRVITTSDTMLEELINLKR